MAKQLDEGEFAASIAVEGNQLGDNLTLAGRIGYASIEETIGFFSGRGIQIHGTV
jgi:hypothetical protein